jgi:hypothetical protein
MGPKNSIILIGAISLLFGYIRYNEDLVFGANTHLNEININNRNFQHINSDLPLSHIIKLTDNLLICSGINIPQIYITKQYLSDDINNGGIYLYNIKKKEFELIEIENYPSKLPFHPHGLSLYKENHENYYLYVINHLIKDDPQKNAEKIEKFRLNINKDTITLDYKNTFLLPQEYFGTLNSIAAVNQNIIYFTTESSFSLPCYSKNDINVIKYLYLVKYKIYEYLNILFRKLNIKKTYLYSYDCEANEINFIYNSEGVSNKGLAYDAKNSLLYMVRAFEKDIKVFEISRNVPSNALFIKRIKTIYNMENIYYDSENQKIYGGIYGSINELKELDYNYINDGNFDSVETFGGFEEIDTQKGYEISDIILFKNELKGISSAIKINNEIYFSSTYQNELLIYPKN